MKNLRKCDVLVAVTMATNEPSHRKICTPFRVITFTGCAAEAIGEDEEGGISNRVLIDDAGVPDA